MNIDNIEFSTYCQRSIIADCLKSVNLNDLATKAINLDTSPDTIGDFLSIIRHEAQVSNRHDLLEILCASGLVS